MPQTEVRLFRSASGEVPFLDWFTNLKARDRKAYTACVQRILALSEHGHDLDRPLAAFLRNGIYELRFKNNTVQYRVLYFFVGKNAAVLSHGIGSPLRANFHAGPDLHTTEATRERFDSEIRWRGKVDGTFAVWIEQLAERLNEPGLPDEMNRVRSIFEPPCNLLICGRQSALL